MLSVRCDRDSKVVLTQGVAGGARLDIKLGRICGGSNTG